MFSLAILIGIYSYLILALGLLGLLYKNYIIWTTIIYLLFCIFWYRRSLINIVYKFFEYSSRLRSNNIFTFVLLFIFFSQVLINLIGALGPELGFDALWYHLTIPKLYLENHAVFYIPGGLLYYSLMPKLTEMLYLSALSINGEILAKLIHFAFGLLSAIALYKLSRNFFTPKISLIAVVVFYSNLVVGWQSTTAYVDLARTFFEIMALWGFVIFWKKGERKWLVESAVMLGLAVSTKLLAIGSLAIFIILMFTVFRFHHPRSPFGHLGGVRILIKDILLYCFIVILLSLPWFVFAYINTGDPVYPFFTEIYNIGFNIELFNPFRFVVDIWGMFVGLSDPISFLYIIFLPLVFLYFFRHLRDSGSSTRLADVLAKRARMTIFQLIAIYSFLAIIVWYITPRTGGGRFILPYLPAFSILIAVVVEKLGPPRRSLSGHLRGDLQLVLISVVIIVSIISIIYRGAANAKYIPVIIGIESKNEFLKTHLNFSFGDYYDTDGYFKKNIKPKDKVLLYGFHNLYYVDFPFIDSSWVKRGDMFNYIATQNTDLPKRFKDWDLVYQNLQTKVKLYSRGLIKWVY